MHLTDVAPASVLYVAKNMRDEDALEIYATQFLDDPAAIMAATMACPAFAWVAWLGDEPVAVVGAAPLHPTVWQVYAYGTNRFEEIAYPLTKFIKRCMIPALAETGVRRAQCLSLASHFKAHRWLENLGAERESVLEGFGRDGEDFYMYFWRGQDVLRRREETTQGQQRRARAPRGRGATGADPGWRKQH